LEEQHHEELANPYPYLDCIIPIWHRDLHLFTRRSEEDRDEAHQSAALAAIEFSMTLPQTSCLNQNESSDSEESYVAIQNPTKPFIVSKDFLDALPACPIIHWASQMFNDPKLCFCPCSIHTKPWRDLKNISSHDDHVYKGTAMIQELMKHLTDKGDPAHTAIFMTLTS
jgi:hypothetical protein